MRELRDTNERETSFPVIHKPFCMYKVRVTNPPSVASVSVWNLRGRFYKMPCDIIALATFINPATLAPFT